MEDLSIYIHIPFCNSKCYYCDFISFTGQENKVEAYISSLITELSLYKKDLKEYKIKTIFIGGGTPSAIDPIYIYRVLDYLYSNFNTHEDMEVSIELNPGTLSLEKLNIYKQAGINRVSIGLQTFNNNILGSLGRRHHAEEFFSSLDMVKEVGFNNINVDLIFGLPDQNLTDGMIDITTLVQLGVHHISYYSLIIEPNTPMYKWHQEGKLHLMDEDSERKLYHQVKEFLKYEGYVHYEISNFSLDGYQCKHNMVYWNIKPYLGVGLSSHSYLMGKRFWNTSKLNDYLDSLSEGNLPVEDEELISKEIEIAEYCIFGLRLIQGINKREFFNRFGVDLRDIYGHTIEKHKKAGLLIEDDRYLRLTDRGLDLANLVEVDFLP
ncbi:MAG: radical SAM family heme chaperone HemW [Tissierellaceae bacterium]